MALDATIRAERDIHIETVSDLANGYRPRRAFPHRKTLELRVPRTRYGNFKPMLLSVLKDQNEEMHRLCHSRYTKGPTTEQVGDVFEELYGHNYSEQWTSPRKTEGRISLSGLVGSQERLLEFRDGEMSEGGMPFSAVVFVSILSKRTRCTEFSSSSETPKMASDFKVLKIDSDTALSQRSLLQLML
jgi:hypothetical protein